MNQSTANTRVIAEAKVNVVSQGGGKVNSYKALSIALDKRLYSTIGAVSRVSGTLLAGLTFRRVMATDIVPKDQRVTWQTSPGTIRASLSSKYAGVELKKFTEQGPVKVEVHTDGAVLLAPVNVNTFPERVPVTLSHPRGPITRRASEDKFKFKSNGRADVATLKEALETVNRVAKETGAVLTIDQGVVKARIEI